MWSTLCSRVIFARIASARPSSGDSVELLGRAGMEIKTRSAASSKNAARPNRFIVPSAILRDRSCIVPPVYFMRARRP